ITPGLGGDKFGWLSGTKIDDAATPQQARDEASKILVLLNGLARFENPKHHNVDLADCVFQSERLHRLCHVAVPRARSVGTSGIVRPLRLQSATWSSRQREARGAFGRR